MWRVIPVQNTRLARRLGRRGLVLILVGIAWIGVGLSVITDPRDRFSGPGESGGPLEWADSGYMSVIWLVGGVIALTNGCLHDRRVVSKHDSVGYNALFTAPFIWTILYIWSAVVYFASDKVHGSPFAIYGFFVYAVISLLIVVIAGWPDPQDPFGGLLGEPPKPPVREE
jgi:hypothetical protein